MVIHLNLHQLKVNQLCDTRKPELSPKIPRLPVSYALHVCLLYDHSAAVTCSPLAPNSPVVTSEYELGKVKLTWLFQLNFSVKPKDVVTTPK